MARCGPAGRCRYFGHNTFSRSGTVQVSAGAPGLRRVLGLGFAVSEFAPPEPGNFRRKDKFRGCVLMIDNNRWDPKNSSPTPVGSILVAEKEALARESLVELFQDVGWRVCAAADSQAAIAQIDAGHNLDVVLIDLVLPSNDLLIKHAQQTLPQAWRVGMALPPVFYPEAHAGLHGYLLKPLVFDELHGLIMQLMTGKVLR